MLGKKSFSMLYLLMKLLMTVKTEAIKLRHTHIVNSKLFFVVKKVIFTTPTPPFILPLNPHLSAECSVSRAHYHMHGILL